jgi:hypothetical protein
MLHPERGFYSLLAQYPAFTFSASVATITSGWSIASSAKAASPWMISYSALLPNTDSHSRVKVNGSGWPGRRSLACSWRAFRAGAPSASL